MRSTVAEVGTTKAQQRPIGGDAHGERAHHERQEEEQDRPVAVPDLRLEAPQVADQQRRHEDGDQRVADDRADLDLRPGEAQRVEHLELLDA